MSSSSEEDVGMPRMKKGRVGDRDGVLFTHHIVCEGGLETGLPRSSKSEQSEGHRWGTGSLKAREQDKE